MRRPRRRDACTPLVENFTPDVMRGGVVDQLPEVRPHGRLAAADVDVEHLHRAPARRSPPGTRRCSARADRAGPSWTGSARRTGCRRRSAPRSGRSARPARMRTARPAAALPRWSRARPARQIIWELASVASARRRPASSASARRPRPARGPRARCTERADDVEQLRALQERQPAGAEVVEQRPEPLRANRHLRVQLPGRRSRSNPASAPLAWVSVDTAHAVDRDLFDQQVRRQLRLPQPAVRLGAVASVMSAVAARSLMTLS